MSLEWLEHSTYGLENRCDKAAINAAAKCRQAEAWRPLSRTEHKLGAPGVIRTRGQRFRKPLLYPTELRGH